MSNADRELRSAAARVEVPELDLAGLAEREGLLDVAYATVESPLGPLVLASTPHGLVRSSYADGSEERVLEDLARRVSPRVLEAPARLDPVRRELDEYFEGRRSSFDVAVDWSILTGFTREILRATAAIPFGSTGTYRSVATEAGSPRAVRAAGNSLGSNPMPIVVPCHRILHTGGGLGGYTGGLERKEYLLRLEGVLEDG
jgi:methylated-DNA-[protein]-cysteine S-methyltransferase